ncbi:MAG: hypothetical protein ACI97K_003074 [Glaciecola sp.]|jgi:hypothetical protein
MKKHLTEAQLISPDKTAELHMVGCTLCTSLFLKNQQIIKQLQSISDIEAPSDMKKVSPYLMNSFIKNRAQHKIEIIQTKESWYRRPLAIAASIIVCVAIFSAGKHEMFKNDSDPDYQIVDENIALKQLQEIIAANQKLEIEIKSLRQASPQYTLAISSQNLTRYEFYSELHAIDDELQNAYFTEDTVEEKTKLWQQRLGLLKAINEGLTNNQTQQKRV